MSKRSTSPVSAHAALMHSAHLAAQTSSAIPNRDRPRWRRPARSKVARGTSIETYPGAAVGLTSARASLPGFVDPWEEAPEPAVCFPCRLPWRRSRPRPSLVQRAIESSLDLGAVDVFEAARERDLPAVRAANEEQVRRRGGRSGELPLHEVSRCGYTEIVAALLEKYPGGAQERSGDGFLPLHLAAGKGHQDVVAALLKRYPGGAREKHNGGWLPLHFAAAKGHNTELVAFLLGEYPDGAQAKTEDGLLPLHLAAWSGHTDIAALLLEKHPQGARERDNDGLVPLHFASHFHGHTRLVATLLDTHPDGARDKTEDGLLPLHLAAASGHASLVTPLLERYPQGAREKSCDGLTPLHLADLNGRAGVVDLLEPYTDSATEMGHSSV